jgi:uncharacterized membrane protein
MKGLVEGIKNILIGGILFLIPLAVIVLVAVQIIKFLVLVAKPMATILPTDTVLGVGIANLLAIGALLLLSFLAGLVAKIAFTQKAVGAVELKLLNQIPGYRAIKQLVEATIHGAEAVQSFIPVGVELKDHSRLAFEVERTERGMVAVYFPSTPNVWSGYLGFVSPEQVRRLDITPGEMIGLLEQLGIGSSKLALEEKEVTA